MEQAEKIRLRQEGNSLHGYRIFIKHSDKDRSLVDCMKDAINSTMNKEIF
ncbi:hypothetical protein QA584_21230 [Anaerocolumna sp. AGMB13025]|nr:hypothetical protein [Anaerocolumna sp. AGMB13025]WFR56116.1 hypothetical protein QA584_21230 [Anaerocolumna sp. AGMB13025]